MAGDPLAALAGKLDDDLRRAARIARLVDQLPDDQIRYQGRLDEQLRAEWTLHWQAQAEARKTLDLIIRAGLGDRHASAREMTARATAQLAETEERLAQAAVTAMTAGVADVLLRHEEDIPGELLWLLDSEIREAVSARLC